MSPLLDAAVVGAGPAGLSAAIRLRWIKSYRSVPCSVAVYDPAPIGGLARIRSARITGPAFHLSGKELIAKLDQDLRDLQIPVYPQSVTKIERVESRWRLYHEDEALADVRAVILATGLRALSNEAEYFGRGVSLTYNGYDFLPELLQRLVAKPGVQRLLVVGNRKTLNFLPNLESIAGRGLEISFLLDEAPSAELAARFGEQVHFGRVLAYRGSDSLDRVSLQLHDGSQQELPCELAFVDYTAFEIFPELACELAGLARDGQRFITVDREGATNLPGIYAAGDITGLYAMVVKGLSEGAVAGFSAYRQIFAEKFGFEPPLFAYAGRDAEQDPKLCDYPEIHPSDRLEALLSEQQMDELHAKADRSQHLQPGHFAAIVKELGQQGALDYVYWLLDEKAITLQPQSPSRRGQALRGS